MIRIPPSWSARWHGRDLFEVLGGLGGNVYRNQDGRKTFRFQLEGKGYFAKLHQGVGWQEILKNLVELRLPIISARNEWRAIRKLEALGVATTPLVAYGKKGFNPARLKSFVVTEELTHTVSLEDFCRDWRNSPPSYALKRALITQVATVARRLHQSGMNHRDFYICHFLLHIPPGVENLDPKDLKVYLIDLHRVQIRRRAPRRWRVKDVGSLFFSSQDIGLTQRDLLRFIRVYQNEPLPQALTGHRRFWRQVRKRGRSLLREWMKKHPAS